MNLLGMADLPGRVTPRSIGARSLHDCAMLSNREVPAENSRRQTTSGCALLPPSQGLRRKRATPEAALVHWSLSETEVSSEVLAKGPLQARSVSKRRKGSHPPFQHITNMLLSSGAHRRGVSERFSTASTQCRYSLLIPQEAGFLPL